MKNLIIAILLLPVLVFLIAINWSEFKEEIDYCYRRYGKYKSRLIAIASLLLPCMVGAQQIFGPIGGGSSGGGASTNYVDTSVNNASNALRRSFILNNSGNGTNTTLYGLTTMTNLAVNDAHGGINYFQALTDTDGNPELFFGDFTTPMFLENVGSGNFGITFPPSTSFTNSGTFTNRGGALFGGTLWVEGVTTHSSSVTNAGRMDTAGGVTNYSTERVVGVSDNGSITNRGGFTNGGAALLLGAQTNASWMTALGPVTNNGLQVVLGSITNAGRIDTAGGVTNYSTERTLGVVDTASLTNRGGFTNGGTTLLLSVQTNASWFTALGPITNNGLQVVLGNTTNAARVDNAGAVTNYGIMETLGATFLQSFTNGVGTTNGGIFLQIGNQTNGGTVDVAGLISLFARISMATNSAFVAPVSGRAIFCTSNYNVYIITPTKTNLFATGM